MTSKSVILCGLYRLDFVVTWLILVVVNASDVRRFGFNPRTAQTRVVSNLVKGFFIALEAFPLQTVSNA